MDRYHMSDTADMVPHIRAMIPVCSVQGCSYPVCLTLNLTVQRRLCYFCLIHEPSTKCMPSKVKRLRRGKALRRDDETLEALAQQPHLGMGYEANLSDA